MSRRSAIHLAIATVLTIGSTLTARAGTNHTYIPNLPYTGPYAIGIGEPSDLWWANSFDAAPGGEWLTRLDASFDGGLAPGTPVSLLVYADPSHNNDPSDLQLLTQVNGTVGTGGTSDIYTPQSFTISPTYVSGDFFVAIEANNVPTSAYIRYDLDSPQGRSFLAYNVAPNLGTMTPTNIQSADQSPAKIEDLAGLTSNTYNFFIGARGRSTEYAKAQDPLVFDGFNTGNFSISSDGIEIAATDAVGGRRGATVLNGTLSVANGVLTLAGGQASIFYGLTYTGGSGYGGSTADSLHANLGGYDILRMHFANPNSTVVMIPPINAGNGNPQSFHIDSSGNVDFDISGSDWTDFNSLDFTFYSYGLGTITLDSITLLATPIPGDVNGDGKIDADDYALLDRGFANHLTGHVNGDLNGDGIINSADYLLLDTAFALANDGLSPSLLAQRQSQFGDSYITALESALPEPTSLTTCLLTLPLLLGRKCT
jgi:hypothetical protein